MNELSIFSHEELMSLTELDLTNKHIQSALQKCKYLSSQEYKSARLHLCLGKIYLELNLANLAESNFKDALQLDAGLLDAKFELAIFARDKGDYSEAKRQLSEILVVSPNNDEVLFYLGDLLFHLQEYQGAQHYLEHLIDVAPNNGPYVYQASEYLLQLSNMADGAVV